MTESALGAYLIRRQVKGAPALDRSIAALSGWVRNAVHVDHILVEALNLAHCGLAPGYLRRHGISVYALGQPEERVTSFRQRKFVRHEGEFFEAVFEAASRWAPLPRELLAAYAIDAMQEEGVRVLLWHTVRQRMPETGPSLCPTPSCRSCGTRWV